MAFFLGLGFLVTRNWEINTAEKLFYSFLTGWVGAIAVLQIWNLFFPVNSVAFWVFLGLSVIGWIFGSQKLINKKIPVSKLVFFGLIGILITALMANQSTFGEVSYDHGLYHRPMINWLESYPLVKGLGNLHHRFAFNNSSFLLAAMLDSGPASGLIFYSFIPTLYTVLLMRLLLGVYRVFSEAWQVKEVFYALISPIALWQFSRVDLASIGFPADPVIYILQIAAIGEFLGIFLRKELDLFNRRRILLLALVLAVGITIKLSFAVFGGMLILLIFWSIWSQLFGENGVKRKLTFEIIGLIVVVVGVWLFRGVVLSGYPLFPSKVLGVAVKWQVPQGYIESVPESIRNWAQHGGDLAANVPLKQWFPYWTQHQNFEMLIAVGLFTVLTIIYLVGINYFGKARQQKEILLVMLAVVVSIAVWFIQAPSERFAASLIWVLPVLPMVLLLNKLKDLPWLQNHAFVALLGLALLTFWFKPEYKNYVSLGETLLKPPLEATLNIGMMKFDPNRFELTNSGLKVFIAADQNEERCYDQPLPCTRKNDFDPRLSLLKIGDIGGGFWVDPTAVKP